MALPADPFSGLNPAESGLTESAVPQVEPRGGVLGTQLGEAEAGIRPNWTQKFGASLKQLSEEVPIGIPGVDAGAPGAWVRGVSDYFRERDLESAGNKKITAAEANKRYPDLPKPFTEDVYPEIADFRASEATRRAKLQEWIDRGPETGLGFQLGMGAISIFDPVNALVNIGGGAVVKAVGLPLKAATIFGENLLGNLAADISSYYQRKREQQDVSLGDTAINAVASAALGTAISKVFSGVTEKFRNAPPEVREKLVREAVAQHESGVRIDSTTLATTQTLRQVGLVNPEGPRSTYRYLELNHPSESVHYEGFAAHNDSPIQVAPELGNDGIHMIDHAEAMNNLSSPPESAVTGRFQANHIDENANFLDIDQPASSPEFASLVSQVKKELGVDAQIPETATIRDLFQQVKTAMDEDRLPSDSLKKIQEQVKSAGFDGYQYTQKIEGEPVHNGAYLFDDSKVIKGQEYQGNPDVVPQNPAQERAYREKMMDRPENYKDYSSDVEEKIQSQKNRPTPDLTKELDPMLEAQKKQSELVLKELEKDDPSVSEHLDEVKRDNATDAQEANALSEMIDCYKKEIP